MWSISLESHNGRLPRSAAPVPTCWPIQQDARVLAIGASTSVRKRPRIARGLHLASAMVLADGFGLGALLGLYGRSGHNRLGLNGVGGRETLWGFLIERILRHSNLKGCGV